MGKLPYNILVVLALLSISGAVTHGAKLSDSNLRLLFRQAKAAEMGNFMNKKTNPCTDFYEFACGNFATINRADIKSPSTGLFERLEDGMTLKFKNLISGKKQIKKMEHIERQLLKFYKSCMYADQIDQESYKSIIDEFGKMPVLEGSSWSEADFDWVDLVAKIAHTYGEKFIINAGMDTDLHNTKINAVYFVKPEFELKSRSMYLDESSITERENYKMGIAYDLEMYLGVESVKAAITAEEILKFEVDLAEGLMPETADFNPSENAKLRTLDELHSIYAPAIDVKRLVIGSLGERVEKIYDYSPSYPENLVEVLGRTSKRVLANYIFFNLVKKFFLNPGANNKDKEIICTAATKESLPKIVDNLIYRTSNNNATANDIKPMWNEIKKVFRERLQSDTSLDWINNRTRLLAIEKLDATVVEINSYDLQELNEEYKTIRFSDQDYIHNQRSLKNLSAIQERELLHKPATTLSDGNSLKFSPVNILNENKIKIPVALLQPAFLWHESYPHAIMYGALGTLIGHELIHSFDNVGQDFDAQGNNNRWWDEQTLSIFNERKMCFSDQYHKYVYEGYQIPELKDQSENIADNGGVRLSYAAYRRWLQTQQDAGQDDAHLQTERLPRLDYSNMELFFISYAQVWCNDIVKSERHRWLLTELHMPGSIRVIGSLSNFEEFSKEFKCPSGAPMNPVDKCIIY